MKTIIIYEDKDILVVQKPAGLATQTAKIGQPDVVSELKRYLAEQEKKNREDRLQPSTADRRTSSGRNMREDRKGTDIYLGIIHRLDQPVEGLLVFAKNKTAAGALTKQLSEGILNKQYYAVICGKPLSKEGKLVDYLVKEGNLAKVVTGYQEKESEIKASDAKKAVLQYRILQEISTPEQLALADIHIDTGRFHQIRVQMSHAGMALLADTKYGDGNALEMKQRLGVQNVALCAYSLAFTHPCDGRKMFFQIMPVGKGFSYFEENNFQAN